MTKEEETRKVVKALRDAGFVPAEKFVGSHRKWYGPNGEIVPLPEGHKTISPGVMRKVLKALGRKEL